MSGIQRLHLAHLPTPLEYLPRLTRHLGGPKIYIKRDDCTGLGTGGNKVRKLEFLLADARQKNATTLVTSGGVQSNHARLTAAAASRLGLGCELVLDTPLENPPPSYLRSGNLLLDHFFGANIHLLGPGQDMAARVTTVAADLKRAGETPYVIPVGGSNALGALGYVECAGELLEQSKSQGIAIDQVVLASGSGGTHAGLLVGLRALASQTPVLGIGVSAPAPEQHKKVRAVTNQTAELIAVAPPAEQDIAVNCDYIGPGYGAPTQEMQSALQLLARLEGLLLDPVYTGKAMAGLIDLINQGTYSEADSIVFVHTGGVAGLFGYADELLDPKQNPLYE